MQGTSVRAKPRAAGDETFGAALRALREAQKTPKGVSLYSRWVNRPAGRVLAAGAYRAGFSPHGVTMLSAVFSFAGIAAVAVFPPSWGLAVAVYTALAVGFALDSADGQLARLRGESSAAGEWLDHVVDCAKITSLHTAVLVAFYRFLDLPGPGWLLLPLGFQLAAVVLFFGGLLTGKLTPPAAPGALRAAPSTLRAVTLLPVDYGVFCGVFLLLGSETAFRYGYAAFCAVHVAFLAAFLVKWFRELSALRQPGPPERSGRPESQA